MQGFGFNGQMKDNEIAGVGNWVNYDDRGFDTRVAHWPTPDKLAAKYPNKSPYSFAGGNPIVNREMDGKDYDIAVDHISHTITVKATYFVPTAGDLKSAQVMNNGMAVWNAQSGAFQYTVGKGKDAVVYNVNFELSPAKVTYSETSYFIAPDQPTSNRVSVLPDAVFNKMYPEGDEGSTEGINVEDVMQVPDRNANDKDIAAHELGHGLGVRHNRGLMAPETGSGSKITKQSIIDILGGAGIGSERKLRETKNNFLGKAINITTTGEAPKDFDKGKVDFAPNKK